jgi:hypothetical protein
MQAVELAVESKERRRRPSPAAATELRELEKLLLRFGEKFPFAQDDVDKLKPKLAAAIHSWQKAEAENSANHERCRAKLATLFAGTIERSIKQLRVDGPDEDKNRDNRAAKEFFGKLWHGNSKYYFDVKGGRLWKRLAS